MDSEKEKDSTIVYSPTYSFSGKSCSFSPNGKYVLFTNGKQFYIMDIEQELITTTVFCSDRVDYAEWSPNSEYILCSIRRSNTIEVIFLNTC